jgi:hypothetical protein
MKKIWLLSLTCLFSLAACTSGNCRSHRENSPVDEKKIEAQAAQLSSSSQERIRIFKYDGSLQCGIGKPIALSEMAKELGGIKVYSSENKPDGLMHIQACGTPTGRANVYEIDKSNLEAAKKKGFKEWTFE